MKRTQKLLALLLSVMMTATACLAGVLPASAEGKTEFAEMFADPLQEDVKLKVRYWLPSGYPASSEKNLLEIDREIKELSEAGYSTVELANVYEGLTASEYKALEQGDGRESYLFGSSYWKETLRQVLKSAKEYGMKVDITMGPHWPAASDEIDINSDAVMKEAVYSVKELAKGETYSGLARDYVSITASTADINLLGVYAAKYLSVTEKSRTSGGYGGGAQTTETWNQYALDHSTMTQLSPNGSGGYNFVAPDDDYVVIEVYEHSTGATIKYSTYNNPAAKYTGLCLDMYNEAGAEEFIRYFEAHCIDDEIVSLLKEVGCNFFEDNFSYDAKNIWTSTLPETFAGKNGYALSEVLPYTLGIPAKGHSSERNSTGTDLETDAPFIIANDTDYTYNRIRADFINAWSSCYPEQHIAVIMKWAKERFGMGFRTQTYGGNIDSGFCAATVSRPEGESIGFSDRFDGYSMLAAGRDMGGKTPILSTEFAASFWDGGAYGYAWDDLAKTAYKAYSAGVNSLFFHGYSYMYSPESVWPGNHAFGTSCSGTWSSRDPQWNHIDMLSGNLRRMQYALQQGTQKSDVAVYESMGNAQGGGPFYDGSALTAQGYSYQLFTPGLLSLDSASVTGGVLNASGPAYKAMIIDNETAVSKENMQKLLAFANAGLKLVFVNALPCISTSVKDKNDEIAAIMNELLKKDNVVHVKGIGEAVAALKDLGITPDAAKTEPETNLLSVHRALSGGDVYFLYNQAEDSTQVTVTLKGKGTPFLLNTWNGTITPIARYTTDGESVTLTVRLSGRDAVLIGIGDAFGSAPSVYATDSTTDLTYKDDTLLARVRENGEYLVKTNDGETYTGTVKDLPAPITIDEWDLKVESWTSGAADDAAVTEKKMIFDGHTAAVAWKDINGLGDAVSGIGTYTTVFNMEDVENLGAVLSFTAVGETFKVILNGRQVPFGNQVSKEIDLGGYLQKGENTLVIEVASSLQNAANAVLGKAGEKEYGIIGAVSIMPYREVALRSAPSAPGQSTPAPSASGQSTPAPQSTARPSGGSTGGSGQSSAPKTGDSYSMVIWFSLLMLSCAGILVTFVGKKRSLSK